MILQGNSIPRLCECRHFSVKKQTLCWQAFSVLVTQLSWKSNGRGHVSSISVWLWVWNACLGNMTHIYKVKYRKGNIYKVNQNRLTSNKWFFLLCELSKASLNWHTFKSKFWFYVFTKSIKTHYRTSKVCNFCVFMIYTDLPSVFYYFDLFWPHIVYLTIGV